MGRQIPNDRSNAAQELGSGLRRSLPIRPQIRRVIYTTNAIESTSASLRKTLKARGSFPTDEAALKSIYLALQNIAARWTMPIKDWRAALNRFAILFEESMPVTL